MYENFLTFFGLRENPFDGSLDPRYSFATPRFQKTVDELLSSIERGNSFALLTGEIGTGKTFLIRRLLEALRARGIPAGFIFYTHVDGNHLFDLVLADFGIRCESRLKSDALQCLRDWLLARPPGSKTPVLIVDEAQGLSDHAFREIQMLLNLETPQQKLLQIVLAGEPTLEDKLARLEFRKLRQRITCRCTTEPFDAAETRSYIQRRLLVAGPQADSIFASGAVELIDAYSRGIPRIINLLCEQALIRAFAEKFRPIPAAIVQDAARAFQLEAEALRPRYPVAAVAIEARTDINTDADADAVLASPLAEPFLASALDPDCAPASIQFEELVLESPVVASPLPELEPEIPAAALESVAEALKEPPRVIVLPKPNRYDYLPMEQRRLLGDFLIDLAEHQIFLPTAKAEPKPFLVAPRGETVNASEQAAGPPQPSKASASPSTRRPVRRGHPLGYAAWRDLGRVLFSLPDPVLWQKRVARFLGWLQHPVNPLQPRTRHVRGGLR